MRHAEAWQREENIPYPVLADDVPGAVHHTDGGMADSTYLIDSDGRVSSYSVWTHAPTLYRAIMALLAEMGRGVVLGATTVCRIWPQR